MRLEKFFEKFELFAEAPGAVARMRELVLQLAVQGRLVAQSSNAEPADALAVKISNDRAAFVKARSLARQRVFAPVTADQFPFDLPYGWLWTRLGNLCRVQAGFAFASTAFIQGESGVPMIRIRDITKDSTQVNYVGEYREEFLVNAGDYLVGMDGNFTVAKWRGPRALLNQRVSRLQWYSQDVEPSFFAIALQHRLSELQGTKAYTTVDHLSSGQIENAVVPLPPLAEQKRIVAKVDELMALCDRLETQQQQRETRHTALARAALARFAEAPTPANLDFLFHPSYAITPADLRKTILTLAVQGKLVPQDPNDEPAEETLAKVLRERGRQEKSLRIKEPSPVEADVEHTPELPSGWRYASPDQLTAFHKNALTIGPFGSSLLKSDYTDEGVPLVFVRDIRSESFGGPETRFVTLGKAEELASHTVRPGDLLITKMGDPPGDTAIYPDERPPAIITADCIKLTPHADVVRAEYLRFVIRASQIAEQFAEITLGVAQQKVSLGRFRCIAIPLPPLAEQRRIVARVDQLMALVDQLETQLADARTKAAALLDAAIHEVMNPAAEVIDLAAYRAAMGCYAIQKMRGKPHFGRTAAMKALYLAQAHVRLELELRPLREAAGPLDTWIYDFEREGGRKAWFTFSEKATSSGARKIEYHAGEALAEQAGKAERMFTAGQREEFDRLLGLFSGKTTEQVEIIATLFAAWNDFLVDGHAPSDDEIVTEVRENWHDSKQRFGRDQLLQWLRWLRANDLVPQGRAPHTIHQPRLRLH